MAALSPVAVAASSSSNSWAASNPCHAARILSKAPSMPLSSPPDPTTPPSEREAGTTQPWLPIDQAPREAGVEIIGAQWYGGKCVREPFVSFWSPTLQKFYCDPTHFILMPRPPT